MMETLQWSRQPRSTVDVSLPGDTLVGSAFSSGASTDDDGVPHTPPDLPFLAPPIKSSSGSSQPTPSHPSNRSRPSSTVLEIALSESTLSPFSRRHLSRSPSPPPSPQLTPTPTSTASASTARSDRHRSLPAGFEHIPWISDDDDSDVEGRLSRSLSPPLHDFLSLPPLSPDLDGDDKALDAGMSSSLSPSSAGGDLPPSPPRTPSPRRRFASLPAGGPGQEEHESSPWATSPERPSSPRPRSATRSGLPTLRSQLSPPPGPSSSSKSLSPSPTRSRSASPSPAKPARPSLSVAGRQTQASSPPPSPRSRSSLQLPTPEDVRARHAASRAGERSGSRSNAQREGGRARERNDEHRDPAERGSGVGAAARGLQLSFSSSSVDGSAAATAAEEQGDDQDDPHSLAYFEQNCHSLSLLRLRHALSLASVYAALPPSSPPLRSISSSGSDASSSARPGRSTPATGTAATPLPCLSAGAAAAVGPSPSSRAAALSARSAGAGVGHMVSQQYRLYAMGRAKAQRTGGVGYWEGGLQAWELLLMD
ncbi:hypothetical protein DMC30DRAFT_199466 [Rhodotorula diobovata]|uniref:Uncharacterized protein n=1 Tax=Rhodotorula diobovata TaxID=5288 RepID=A0A5C5FZ86_9BASI|nr:hypothetical protein DMC30DRAFT_199466 [Rhodotorula diobovata]